jgi:hypothetical protein
MFPRAEGMAMALRAGALERSSSRWLSHHAVRVVIELLRRKRWSIVFFEMIGRMAVVQGYLIGRKISFVESLRVRNGRKF